MTLSTDSAALPYSSLKTHDRLLLLFKEHCLYSKYSSLEIEPSSTAPKILRLVRVLRWKAVRADAVETSLQQASPCRPLLQSILIWRPDLGAQIRATSPEQVECDRNVPSVRRGQRRALGLPRTAEPKALPFPLSV